MTSLLDGPPAVLGVQTPRLHSLPADLASRFTGQDAIELAASAGLHLDPWQQLVLRDGLAERADGTWAAFEVALVVPRQCGKGSVLEALELASLFLSDPDAPPPLILHSAHEFKTSAEHFRRMRDLIDGADHLRKRVRIVRTASGSESIELHSGARLRFVTRSGGSGRGFSADLIVVDEAYNLTAEAMAAMLPTLSSRRNPQVWYTSSAGMPASTQLARIRERGTTGGTRLAYFEWSAPDEADLDDPQAWAQANPALGIRIPAEFVAAEREAMPPEQFARERLGIWATVRQDEPVLPLSVWSALEVGSVDMAAPAFSVEVAKGRTLATIGAAWRHDGKPHLEVVEERPGTAWVADRIAELVARYSASTVVLDLDTEAAALVDELSSRGLPVTTVRAERAEACGNWFEAAADGALSHNGDPAIGEAIRNATWKDIGDGRRAFSRQKSAGPIGALYAVVLALHGLNGEQGGPNLW